MYKRNNTTQASGVRVHVAVYAAAVYVWGIYVQVFLWLKAFSWL
jgi:hypothetical protein